MLFRRVLICCLLITGIFISRAAGQNSPEQLLKKALQLQEQAKYEQSSSLLKKVLPVFKSAQKWDEVANCYNELSFNSRSQNHLDNAETYAQKVLKLDKERRNISAFEMASAHQNMGAVKAESGHFEVALGWFENGLALTKKEVDFAPLTANLIAEIGSVYHELGKFDQAMEKYRKGISLLDADNPDHQKQLAKLYNYIGINYVSRGDFDRARIFYRRELEMYKTLYGKGHPNVAGVYNNLGGLSYRTGDVGKAISYFEKAAASFEASYGTTNHPNVAMTFNNIGAAYFQLDRLEQSVVYLEKSAEIKRQIRGPNHPDLAVSLNNIGGLYLEMGKLEKAKQSLQRALTIRKKALGPAHPKLTNTYSSLGNLFLKQDRPDSAIAYFEREIEITRKQRGERHPYVADALSNIGRSYAEQQYFDRALINYQEALQVLADDFTGSDYAENPPVANLRYPNYAVNVLYEKGKTLKRHYEKNQNPKALKAGLATFMRLSEVLDFLQTSFQNMQSKLLMSREAHRMYEHGIEVSYYLYKETNDPVYLKKAFYFSEKSKTRVISELIKNNRSQKFAGVPDSLIAYEDELRRQITEINGRLYRSLDDSAKKEQVRRLRNSLFTLNQSLDNHLQYLEEKYPRYHDLKYNHEIPAVNEIQRMLRKKNRTLVEYFHGAKSSWVFVMDGQNLKLTPLPHVSLLKDKVNRFRQSIIQKKDSTYLDLGFLLYEKLLNPVIKQVRTNSILFIPDGVLNLLPFEALLTQEQDARQEAVSYAMLPYLINDFSVSYSPSVSLSALFLEDNRQNFTDDFAAFAPGFNFSDHAVKTRDSNARKKWMPLPFSKREVVNIAGLFEEESGFWSIFFGDSSESELFLENQATEKNFKTAELSRYKYLHLATHAFASDTGSNRSGIVFHQTTGDEEDDILFSEEIYNLKLKNKLLVLSACETAMGKVVRGEGIIGLSRAFRYAGVENLLVSLWNVDDRSTARLMVLFYKNHLEGNSFSQSLRMAKLDLKNHPVYSHPRYWAPFIFMGQ